MLMHYGWRDALQHDFAAFAARGLAPARVVAQHRGLWRLATDAGEVDGRLCGHLAHDAAPGGYPVAGDWVAITPGDGCALIEAVLPRRTAFTRQAAGTANALQVLAANIDLVVITASLNAELNLRRLERYLAATYESGAEPVILLTKADLCEDRAALVEAVEAIAFGVPVLVVSAETGEGLAALGDLLRPGATAVLLGSSGVGKSTLVNALLGQARMATAAIRKGDAHGRHTTTHRELIALPSGALILDTPGMRELALWQADAGLEAVFADAVSQVEQIAQACRFSDCGHGNEPGCAVRAALDDGTLDADRWESFRKLRRELAHAVRQEDPLARQMERRRWASIHKAARVRTKAKREIDD